MSARRAPLDDLRATLSELSSVVVAFSGGADSAFLAQVANDTLGHELTLCVTADSASLAPAEADDCAALAAEWGLNWRLLPSAELADPTYVANGPDRCARCKTALMDVLAPLAAERGATVVLGVNTDDLGDFRPGQAAAAARGAQFPLVTAGFSKEAVRAASRSLGLRTWDKPAGACLASRLPYGTPVTEPVLRSVARSEAGLHELGLHQLRVRHHGTVARVEVPIEEFDLVLLRRAEVVAVIREAGYDHVALDLEGFTSGSLNRSLVVATAAGARKTTA
jgi:pyridinium-3,5-biscarboxylic acid mononucleotide sulfurtransferase